MAGRWWLSVHVLSQFANGVIVVGGGRCALLRVVGCLSLVVVRGHCVVVRAIAMRARGGGGAGRRHGRETGGARAGGTVALRVAVVRARSPHRARAIIARRTRCAHFWSRGLSRLYRFVPLSRVCTGLDLTPLFLHQKCAHRIRRAFVAVGS